MIEHAGFQRADIAGKPLPGRRRHQIKARTRPPRPQIDDDHQAPDAALGILLGQPVDLAGDGRGDLLGDQAARIEREIAEQRRREQHEDRQIDQRQLERGGADEFAERGHVRLSRARAPNSLSEKSSSQNSSAARRPACRLAASARRNSTRRILPEIVFGSSANSMPAHPFERRQRRAAMPEDRQRGGAIRRVAGRERQKGLRHREPHRIGRRHDGRLGHRRMLDQRAFQLERADAVVGRFEHIVGAADIGQIAVVVDAGDIAGAIDARRDAPRTPPSSP